MGKENQIFMYFFCEKYFLEIPEAGFSDIETEWKKRYTQKSRPGVCAAGCGQRMR